MIENELRVQLTRLMQATEKSDGDGIGNAVRELDRLKTEHSSEIKGHLKHYLDNRSYGKALAFLESPKT